MPSPARCDACLLPRLSRAASSSLGTERQHFLVKNNSKTPQEQQNHCNRSFAAVTPGKRPPCTTLQWLLEYCFDAGMATMRGHRTIQLSHVAHAHTFVSLQCAILVHHNHLDTPHCPHITTKLVSQVCQLHASTPAPSPPGGFLFEAFLPSRYLKPFFLGEACSIGTCCFSLLLSRYGPQISLIYIYIYISLSICKPIYII